MASAAEDMGFSETVIKGIAEELIPLSYASPLCEPVSNSQELLPTVLKLLVDISARQAIASFSQSLMKTCPGFRKHSKDPAGIQLKLWRLILKQRLFPFEFVMANWQCIVVSLICVFTTVNNIFLTTEEVSEAFGASSSGTENYNVEMYLLSIILNDESYMVKALAVKTRRLRKLKARRAKSAAYPYVATTPASDPFKCSLRGLENNSFIEFAGSIDRDDSDEAWKVKRPRNGPLDGRWNFRKETVPRIFCDQ
ncbi:hypothetical protein G6011_00866 [Alternaria panax]|uniref:Uncharacterized protein n=1 Tax=Alternaria panax TaxID=48097 RepID=A0AAD4NW30_9PLEO|nr:hypothetical protein G6011_00866 [Alternaria panax]